MSVRIRLFSTIRQVVGQSDVEWDAPVENAQELWNALSEQHPALKPMGGSRVVAVNHQHVSQDHPLKDGDEVAFFPPVSGG
jgi:molybdopterin synthase sulfur carrier subunit